MRAALATLALALLLLPAPAQAAHPAQRDLLQDVLDGAPVYAYVNSTGSAAAGMAGERETTSGEGRVLQQADFTWTHEYAWSGYVQMRLVEDHGVAGVGRFLQSFRTQRAATQSWETWEEGVKVGETRVEDRCEAAHTARFVDLPRPAGATGTLDVERGTLRFTLGGMGALLLPPDAQGPCTRVSTGEGRGRAPERHETPGAPLEPLGASILAAEHAARGLDPASLTFEVPLAERAHTYAHTLRASLPDPREEGWEDLLCGRPVPHGYDAGECEARGKVDLRIVVDPCAWHAERYRHHAEQLQGVAPPPKGVATSVLLAYGDLFREARAAVLADARAHLIACGELPGDLDALLRRKLVEYRDALVEHVERAGPEEDSVGELVRVERETRLMGEPPSEAVSAILEDVWAPPRGQGTLTAQVHSPVSLHAWTPDGRHVGWNRTTGTLDLQVEGATFEGEPGTVQRLVLPAGHYRLEVDELAQGDYLLDVTWAADGLEGSESFLAHGRPGETLSTHYLFADTPDGLAIDAGPARRGATDAASFRFVDDAPLRAPAPSAAPGGASQDTRDAPGPGVLALAAALAAAGCLWRRRRG